RGRKEARRGTQPPERIAPTRGSRISGAAGVGDGSDPALAAPRAQFLFGLGGDRNLLALALDPSGAGSVPALGRGDPASSLRRGVQPDLSQASRHDQPAAVSSAAPVHVPDVRNLALHGRDRVFGRTEVGPRHSGRALPTGGAGSLADRILHPDPHPLENLRTVQPVSRLAGRPSRQLTARFALMRSKTLNLPSSSMITPIDSPSTPPSGLSVNTREPSYNCSCSAPGRRSSYQSASS